MTDYILDHHRYAGEGARLALMSQLLDPIDRRYIDELGVGPGTRALEVGCGNGSISAWLGERTAPGGGVVALDLDLSLVDAGATNVEFRKGDILAGPVERDGFDIRHGSRCAASASGCASGDRKSRRKCAAWWVDSVDRARLSSG
jgi:tRNA A58 N-methylase Trm61